MSILFHEMLFLQDFFYYELSVRRILRAIGYALNMLDEHKRRWYAAKVQTANCIMATIENKENAENIIGCFDVQKHGNKYGGLKTGSSLENTS